MVREFELLGATHLAALALLAVGCVVAVRGGRRVRGTPGEKTACRAIAAASVVLVLPWQLWTLQPGEFTLAYSLPFELCDLAWIVSLVALLTRRPWATAAVYYWGLTLTTQAIATPRLKVDFPAYDFLGFWAEHLLVVWTAVFLTWGLGYRPSWRALGRTAAVTAVWAGAMYVFNSTAGTNYLFVNRKPATASVLDLFGPWPVYLLVEFTVALALWALITWPWTRTHDPGLARAR